MKKTEEKISIALSAKQYEALMKWSYVGQSVYYMYHHPGRKKIDEVDDFFQYLFSLGKNLKKVIRYEDGGYDLTDKSTAEISEKLMDFIDAAINEIADEQLKVELLDKEVNRPKYEA